jgi:hypothetical protein
MNKSLVNKFTTFAAAAAACTLIVGCASGPTFSQYRPTVPPCPAGEGRIWFYRPGWGGAAVKPDVKMDGAVVGKATAEGFFHADAAPGTHEVSVTTEWTHKRNVTLDANTESYVRLNLYPGVFVGHIVPEQVPPTKALPEMQNLHLTD